MPVELTSPIELPTVRPVRGSTIAVAAALLFAVACSNDGAKSAAPASGKGDGDVVATYDGKRLTTADLQREIERLPPRSRLQLSNPERVRQFVDNYVLNQLLYAEGEAKGYADDPEIQRQVDELRQRLIVQRVMKDFQEAPDISDAEVRAYYDANQRLFSGAQIRASHILVKDEASARSLREQLRTDPSKFEELAKANSTDTATAARGGDLGYFGQGRMVADFERVAFSLENPGDISEVVKTPFGFHIIKLVERRDGTLKPFDETKDRIRVALVNERRQELVNKRFEDLKAKAKVTVNDDALSKIDLPRPTPAAAPPGSPLGQPSAASGH